MKIILHRVNSIEMLHKTPLHFGVEIDIRSNSNLLYLHHDPFSKGESFEEWLKFFEHQTLILNVKEEGLESSILKLMKKYNINDLTIAKPNYIVSSLNNIHNIIPIH